MLLTGERVGAYGEEQHYAQRGAQHPANGMEDRHSRARVHEPGGVSNNYGASLLARNMTDEDRARYCQSRESELPERESGKQTVRGEKTEEDEETMACVRCV